MTDVDLTEIILRAPRDREEILVAQLIEVAPLGFRHDDLPDGRIEFGVYVPGAEAHQLCKQLVRDLAIDDHELVCVAGDWSQKWKEFHQPVTIGNLWVGPPWELPAPDGLIPVVIEPAQGFGTGAHPTTHLMLRLLQEQPRSSVVDIGCGSGVLAVAAAKLGFAPIFAVDNDRLAIDSTNDNLVRNSVDGVRVSVANAIREDIPRAELTLANLTLIPLVALAPRFRSQRVIVSGLLRSQVEDATAAFEQSNYSVRERLDREGWVALVLDSRDAPQAVPGGSII